MVTLKATIVALTSVLCVLSTDAALAAEKPGRSIYSATSKHSLSARTRHGFVRVSSPTRAGRKAQKFEIRHGDCGSSDGYSDCETDRQRVERWESNKDRIQKVGSSTWYGWSIYLPTDFRDIDPANTTLGQVKMTGWREPMWFMNARGGRLRTMFATQDECTVAKLSQMRSKWTDIVVYADYSTKVSGAESFAVWVNGKKVCSKQRPLVTQEMLNRSKRSMYFRYGIYNSYVSRWLDRNKTKPVSAVGFTDKHQKSGLILQSSSSQPFAYDWGVQLPTQVVIYDEMRYGKSRQAIDPQFLQEAGVNAAD